MKTMPTENGSFENMDHKTYAVKGITFTVKNSQSEQDLSETRAIRDNVKRTVSEQRANGHRIAKYNSVQKRAYFE